MLSLDSHDQLSLVLSSASCCTTRKPRPIVRRARVKQLFLLLVLAVLLLLTHDQFIPGVEAATKHQRCTVFCKAALAACSRAHPFAIIACIAAVKSGACHAACMRT